MSTSPSGVVYGQWTEPSYEIKVRGKMHLWGSAGITKDISFDKQLVLHIHNDLFGEEITLGTQNASGTRELGTLKRGECVSIPLNSISGVFASCETHTTVCCLIK